MTTADFEGVCPTCDRPIVVNADLPIQRRRCRPCRTTYAVATRIDGSRYLVAVRSTTIKARRLAQEQHNLVVRWAYLLVLAMLGVWCVICLPTYLPGLAGGAIRIVGTFGLMLYVFSRRNDHLANWHPTRHRTVGTERTSCVDAEFRGTSERREVGAD